MKMKMEMEMEMTDSQNMGEKVIDVSVHCSPIDKESYPPVVFPPCDWPISCRFVSIST